MTLQKDALAAANRSKAMAHPLRAKILLLLAEQPGSPADLVDRLEEEAPAGLTRSALTSEVAHHCKYLKQLGCAEVIEERKTKGNLVRLIYRATEQHLVNTGEWEELPAEAKESNGIQFAQTQIDTLVEWSRLRGWATEDFHVTSDRYWLDEEGFERFMEITEEARLAYEAEATRAAERLSASGDRGTRTAAMLVNVKLPER